MVIRVKTARKKVFEHKAPARIVAVLGGRLSEEGQLLDQQMNSALSNYLKKKRFSGQFGEYALFAVNDGEVVLFDLGKRRGHTLDQLRAVGVKLAEIAAGLASRDIVVENFLADRFGKESASYALAEGLFLGAYSFDKYKNEVKVIRRNFVIAHGHGPAVERARVVMDGVYLARDLVNEPPNILNPVELARRAQAMAEEAGLEIRVFGPEKIQELGMGAYWAVAKGSDNEPRFIEIVYRPKEAVDGHIALVGKGLTFDTGGYSLKPPKSMITMKGDMAGAAAVIGAMKVIAELKPPLEVRAYIAAAENMISGHAYRVDDVLKAYNGKTIEVLNTDAEGRLTLADALAYASEKKPEALVELSTLTGSCVVALGAQIAGLFSEEESLAREVARAAAEAGEKVWQLPMEPAYKKLLKSDIADIKNVGERAGGAIQAALFLSEFVNVPFVHLDIAGPGFAEEKKDNPDGPAGGTGFGVRTLVRWIERRV